MQVEEPNNPDLLDDDFLHDLHQATALEKASWAIQDAGLTFLKIASPMPKQQAERLGEATLLQEFINTYHFFAGYMGTIERQKVFKRFDDQPLHLHAVQQQYIQEMDAVTAKMHMGLFDYIFFGLPFLATWMSLNPQIASEADRETQIVHHYRTVTNTTQTNALTPLAILVSGLSALPRLIFGMVLTVLSSPVVLVVHAIAAFANWVKRPRVNVPVNVEAEPLLDQAPEDDHDNDDVVVDAQVLDNQNHLAPANEGDVVLDMDALAPAPGAAVPPPAFRSSVANMLDQMPVNPDAADDEWEYVLVSVSEDEAAQTNVPEAAAEDLADNSHMDSADEDSDDELTPLNLR